MSRRWLLGQNSELKADGVFNWTIPAWAIRLKDGRNFNACPNAGVCARLCYARNGTYLFPEVRAAHERNLLMVLDHLPEWEIQMTDELKEKRYRDAHVRIHDAGDFFSDDYLAAWLRIIRVTPWVIFYAYTKEVSRFKRMIEPDAPANFKWIYSLGGKEDHLIDKENDRHADVFPDEVYAKVFGYASQEESDLLAIYGPKKVGIVQNNIPGFRAKQGGRTFGDMQEAKEWRGRSNTRT